MGVLDMRRGSVPIESLFVLIVILVMVITAFFGNYLLNELNDDIQSDSTLSESTKNVTQNITNRYTSTFDGVILGLFILLWGLSIVASLFVDTHPIFFVFSIILLAVVLVAAAFVSDIYSEFISDDTFSGYEALFPMTNFLMSNLMIVILLIGFSVGLVLYGKTRGSP